MVLSLMLAHTVRHVKTCKVEHCNLFFRHTTGDKQAQVYEPSAVHSAVQLGCSAWSCG